MQKNMRLLQKICRFMYMRRRMLLCACAAALALTVVAVAAFAADLNTHVEKLTILKNSQPVKDNDSLSLADVLTMHYEIWDIRVESTNPAELYFYNSPTTIDRTRPIDITAEYELKLPQYLKCAHNFNTISIMSGTVPIATVDYKDDDTVKLKFDQNLIQSLIDNNIDHIHSLEFSFSAELDDAAIDKRNEVKLDLGNNETVTVKITENTPKHAELTSKACKNSAGDPKIDPVTGHFHWEVTIDPEVPFCDASGTPVYTQGYEFRDVLGSMQTYVPNTFKIAWGAGTAASKNATVNTNNVLEYTFATGAPGVPAEVLDAPVTITYETEPADGLFFDDNAGKMRDPSSVRVTNTATLYRPDPSGPVEINSKSGGVDYEGKNWLTKTSGDIDRLNKTITWTLTVDTNGRGFNYIKVYDQFSDGTGGNENLLYVPGSLTVNNVSASEAAGFDGHNNNLLYTINNPTEAEYVIKYKTAFPSVNLEDNDVKNVSNGAWLEFEWATGHGPGPGTTPYGIPTVGKPVSLHASIIAKGGVYDAATKLIKWTVTVNANRLDIAGADITDELGTRTWQGPILLNGFMADGITRVDLPAADCTAYTSGTKPNYNVSITEDAVTAGLYHIELDKGAGVNRLDTDTVDVIYYTEATDPAFYANNATTEFENTATIANITLGPTTQPTPLPGTFTATAKPKGTSRVLDKDAVGYNFMDNEIEWKLTVNANKMHLTNATVTDVLPSYLTLTGSATYSPAGTYPQPTVIGDTLTFNLGAVSQELTIHFKVKLNVDATNLPGGFTFGKTNTAGGAAPLNIANTADLTTDEYLNGHVTEGDDIDIHNTLLDKQGVQDAVTGRVEYTIELNQNGADLSLVDPNAFVSDELPASLFVDLDEVHLYEATVNPSTGAFIQGAEVSLSFQQKRLVPPNNLQVTLPNPKGRYILKYGAYINATAGGSITLTNSAGLGPDGKTGDKTISTHATAPSSGSASLIPGKTALTIQKTDAQDPQVVLPGAVYGLYAPDPGGQGEYLFQIATTAIDASGAASATFIGLTPNQDYTLRELTAPSGYALAAPVTVTAGTVGVLVTLPVQDFKRAAIGGGGADDTGVQIPEAGDEAMPRLWAGLILLASAGLCVSRRRSHKSR